MGRENFHPVMTFDYYEEALKNFSDDAYVLVCSDDPEWCLEQEFFGDDRFLINTDVPEYEHICMEGDGKYRNSKVPYTDLCLMTLCDGAILSPSTLGWWGAWLQKSRSNPIVAPKNWFGPDNSHNDLSDFYPEGWIVQ